MSHDRGQVTSARRTPELERWFERYAQTHRHPVNIKIHMICVPLIFAALVALLSVWRIAEGFGGVPVTGAWILILGALVFYLRISWRHAVVMGGLAVSLAAASVVGIEHWGNGFVVASGGVFALAWVGQFVGHRIEGAKPAFFDDLLFLLIGPLWVMEEMVEILRPPSRGI